MMTPLPPLSPRMPFTSMKLKPLPGLSFTSPALSFINPNPTRSSLPLSLSGFPPTIYDNDCRAIKLPFVRVLASSADAPGITPDPGASEDRHLPNPGTSEDVVPTTIPRKTRRGRRSEAVAVQDFVRGSLDRAFASIRKQDAEILEGKGEVLKGSSEDDLVADGEREFVLEEEDPDWPLDADVGWGIRASNYFNKHPLKNVILDGVEIDWEGEMDEGWVKEINCLEWEAFAFHPSPLIVLVFERYKRTADNWKLLKELEKAAKVYWSAKDRLPPRTIKVDINIERDLAYALKVKKCPQILFLRGNKILYREKEMRTADELVQMIAHFYYNAKKPSWIDDVEVAPPF